LFKVKQKIKVMGLRFPRIVDFEWEVVVRVVDGEDDKCYFRTLEEARKDYDITPQYPICLRVLYHENDDTPSEYVYIENNGWELEKEDYYGNPIPKRFQRELFDFIEQYRKEKTS
jgi:hypothetical protein